VAPGQVLAGWQVAVNPLPDKIESRYLLRIIMVYKRLFNVYFQDTFIGQVEDYTEDNAILQLVNHQVAHLCMACKIK
jgi:hypothetical protein